MLNRMRGTSKTVCSVHTEHTYNHAVHTEWTYVRSVATVKAVYVCAVIMTWISYHIILSYFMAAHFNTLRMHLSRDLLTSDILIFCKIIEEMILCVVFKNASAN